MIQYDESGHLPICIYHNIKVLLEVFVACDHRTPEWLVQISPKHCIGPHAMCIILANGKKH